MIREISIDSQDTLKAANWLTGKSWKLSKVLYNDTVVKFYGSANLFITSEGKYNEIYQGLLLPEVDYGPCTGVSEGVIIVKRLQLRSLVTEQTETSSTFDSSDCYLVDEDMKDVRSQTEYRFESDIMFKVTKFAMADEPSVVFEFQPDPSPPNETKVIEVAKKGVPIVVNMNSDSYVEDKNANDNLTLLRTICEIEGRKNPVVTQLLSSQLLGAGRTVHQTYSIPATGDWIDGRSTHSFPKNSSCNAPTYKYLQNSESSPNNPLDRTNILGSIFYGCGGTCTYRLISSEIGPDGSYRSFSVEWSCQNISHEDRIGPSVFGSKIENYNGKVKCP